MEFIIAVLTVIVAYLIGSINFAVIFTKKFNNVDVRDFGSGNAGATNVMRVSGSKAGIFTFVADALKGAVAAGLGRVVSYYVLSGSELSVCNAACNPIHIAFACSLACMLGHCFPVFFGFRGGKGVATSVGLFYVCCPISITFGLICFAVSMIISKTVSLSSLIATAAVVISTSVLAFCGYFKYNANPFFITAIMLACGVIIFLRHKENIVRILNGTEKKFTVKKGA